MTLISPIILKKYGIPFSRVCTGRRKGPGMVTTGLGRWSLIFCRGSGGGHRTSVGLAGSFFTVSKPQSPLPEYRSLTVQATSSVNCLQPTGWLSTGKVSCLAMGGSAFLSMETESVQCTELKAVKEGSEVGESALWQLLGDR